jgi:parallel beta-helix repeat protein
MTGRFSQNRFLGLESLEGRTLMSSYYISTTGSDSNAGTSAAPWKTIQKAVVGIKAGDIVTVKAGTYNGFILGWDGTISGTAAAPITFKAEAGVIINTPNNKTRDGISAENCNYIIIDGFTIQPNSTDLAWRAGIRFGGGGIGNVARNNTVLMRAKDTQGIFSSFNQNQVVENNEVSGNQDAGIYCSNSAVNPTVRNNYVHDLSNTSGQGVGIHFNGDVGQGGIGIVDGGTVEGNRVVNCGTGISMDGVQNATVRNNLIQNIHGKGINLYMSDASGACKNDIVENNTVVLASDGYFPIGVRFGSTNVKVLNNIGLNGSRSFVTDAESASGLVVDYNIWGSANFSKDNDSSWMSFATWQASGKDTHSKTSTAGALFVNSTSDFHLLSTALAVNTGTSTSAPSVDFDGNARPSGGVYDIGAYEYGSSGGGGGVTIPADPTLLSASATAWNQIHLSWTDNSTNETGFSVYRKTGSTGTFAQIGTVGAGVTTYDDNTVAGNTSYYYKVVATNSAGSSTNSTNIDSALTPAQPTAPAAPSAAVATATAYNAVTVTWTDGSSDETGFKIERQTGTAAFGQIGTVGAGIVTYSDTTAAGSTQYTYRVRATNSVGDSAYATAAAVTTPAAPTVPNAPASVVASATSTTQVDLTWTDMSSDETGFRIERKIGTGSFTLLTNVNANVTSYSDTTASAATQYTYRVRSSNAVGSSAFTTSSAVTTPAAPTAPAAPNGLTAIVAGTDSVDLSWTDASSNETGFKIERMTGAGSFVEIDTVGAGVTTYGDTGLVASTLYTYRVRATNAVGDSAYTANATATTDAVPSVPADPSNLVATANSATQITLTWADNSANETGFRIERSLDGSSGWSQAGTVAKNVTTFVNNTGLFASTPYFYRVVATNAVGDSGFTLNATATTQALPTVPAVPTGLAAAAASTTQINLSWTDASSDETGFKVERSINGSTWTEIGTTGAGVATYQSTGLSAGTTYYFRVRATNVAGDSDYSNVDIAATQAAPASDTTAPTMSAALGAITAAGNGTYTFTVTYNDDTAVDDTLLDSDDLLVSGPNGYSQRATFVSLASSNAGKTVTATYKFTAPGAAWTWQDDGAYVIALRAQEVADDAGNFTAAGNLGTVNAAVPSVDYAGNSRATARYLGVITATKVSAPADTVETLDIQDYYRVRISSTMTLTAKVFNLTDDANLQLRAEDGTLIQASGRAGTSYEYISRTLKAGTYYFRVINNGARGTNYSMRVAMATPAVGGAPGLKGPDYAGNSRADARKIGSFTKGRVSVYTDLVAPADTQDYYRFDMAAAGTFSAKLTELAGDVNMQLLDSAGKLIQISGNTGNSDEYISRQLSAGTYYLRLYTLGGNGTNYRLRTAAA